MFLHSRVVFLNTKTIKIVIKKQNVINILLHHFAGHKPVKSEKHLNKMSVKANYYVKLSSRHNLDQSLSSNAVGVSERLRL